MTNKEKSLPKEKGLPKQKRTEAIAWAAGKAGTSYGKLMLTLTDKQKQAIYKDYQKHLEEKERRALSWIREEEIKTKQKRSDRA